jgi:hypothetical protein
MRFNCPACSAEVLFKSKSSIFGVCSYCSSTLVRRDMNLETLGKMAELPPDVSTLQIGTMGTYKNNRFEIIGRKKMSWEDGYWNEWFMMFDNGKEGWLAEAQGFLAVSFKTESVLIPEKKQINIESKIQFNKMIFEAEDIKEAVCSGSSGELPNQSLKGEKSLCVDLISSEGNFLSIVYGTDKTEAYVGEYVEFDELKLMNLREIDGW